MFARIKQSETEIGMIKQQVIKVAELFENKEVNQNYSVEILLKFIKDKSTKLKSKYEELKNESQILKN